MSNELHDLLGRGAAKPSSDVDVDALVRTARGRRRRRVGVVAGAVVLAIALVMGTVAIAQPSSKVSIPTRAAAQSSTVPDGWTVVENRDERVSLAIPPEWMKVEAPPFQLLTVGTADFAPTKTIAPCPSESTQVPPVQGTWVAVAEFPDTPDGSNFRIVVLPGIPNVDVAVADRPADLQTAPSSRGVCGASSYSVTAFRDGGRVIVALIVTTDGSSLDLGYQVLNTLHVGASPTTVRTTVPVSTTPTTVPPTTVLPTTVPTAPANVSSDEGAIRDVFLAWLDATERNAMDGIVEDFASIAATHLEGMHQHSEADLLKYSGRVDSVTIIDDTHADVRYSVLFDGRPQFSNMPGAAIRIDGKWMVTRETVCNLLTYGGLHCPPRA